MRFLHSRLPLIVSGSLLMLSLAPALHAGSAVASDQHGGYGYSHGSRSQRELRREAVQQCCDQSEHPDDVKIVAENREQGAGCIVRYRSCGRQHIYACVGADDARAAYRRAARGARDSGAEGEIEVVERWED